MTILKDVIAELVSMFIGDARLSIAILTVVAAAFGLVKLVNVEPLIGGAVLLVGCLVIVIEAVRRASPSNAAATEVKQMSTPK